MRYQRCVNNLGETISQLRGSVYHGDRGDSLVGVCINKGCIFCLTNDHRL